VLRSQFEHTTTPGGFVVPDFTGYESPSISIVYGPSNAIGWTSVDPIFSKSSSAAGSFASLLSDFGPIPSVFAGFASGR
jgi:hypothetical protein